MSTSPTFASLPHLLHPVEHQHQHQQHLHSLPHQVVPPLKSSSSSSTRRLVHKDKQKHNESESRRRGRLRSQFHELRIAALCNKKDRFSILNTAIDKLTQQTERIQTLEQQQQHMDTLIQQLQQQIQQLQEHHPAAAGAAQEEQQQQSSQAHLDNPSSTEHNHTTTASSNSNNSTTHNGNNALSTKLDDSTTEQITPIHHTTSPSSTTASTTPSTAAVISAGLSVDSLSSFPLLSGIPTAFIALDARFRDVNTAFSLLTGYTPEFLSRTTLFSLSHPDELVATFAYLKRLLAGEVDATEFNKLLIRADHSIVSVHCSITMAKKGGKPEFYIMFAVPHQQMTTLIPSPHNSGLIGSTSGNVSNANMSTATIPLVPASAVAVAAAAAIPSPASSLHHHQNPVVTSIPAPAAVLSRHTSRGDNVSSSLPAQHYIPMNSIPSLPSHTHTHTHTSNR